MYIVYVLRSEASGKIYIGYSRNLDIRLLRHSMRLPPKKTSYTAKNKGPWVVAYKEIFSTKQEAIKKEKYLKSHMGRDYVRNVLMDLAGR